MGNWIIAIIIFALGIVLLILGTIVPLVKRKKCTERVMASIISKKAKSYSADDGTTYNYMIATVTYSCRGKTYKKKMNIGHGSHQSYVPLKINPSRPNMCLLDDRKLFTSGIVIYSITSVVFIAGAVLWVLAVCTSVLV